MIVTEAQRNAIASLIVATQRQLRPSAVIYQVDVDEMMKDDELMQGALLLIRAGAKDPLLMG